MLLDLFIGRLSVPVEAKPLVRVLRVELVPAIPLFWIVREIGRSGGDGKHKGEERPVWRASWLQLPCPSRGGVRDARYAIRRESPAEL
jgi:hypothetical protein